MSQQDSEAGPSTAPPPPTLEETLSSLDVKDSTESNPKAKSKNRKSKPKSKDPKPTTAPQVKLPKAPKPVPTPIEAFENPAEGEEETVHGVYESIAPHFSQTRHKPWPLITTFLNSLPPNSLGLDSGAGNGKYLPTAHAAGHGMIALDRSLGLLGIAKEQEGGVDVIRGDLGCRGWRDGVFDFTISVAAIHHLSTPIRRRQAVQALLPALKHNQSAPYSRFFIYVWAYEQGELSKRRMGVKATQPEGDKGEEGGVPTKEAEGRIEEKIQDVLVPWVLRSKPKPKPKAKTKIRMKSGPNSKPPSSLDSTPREEENEDTRTSGVMEGNIRADREKEEDEEKDKEELGEEEEEKEQVFNRYYHLFVEGELRELIHQAGEVEGYRILPSFSSSTSPSSPAVSSTLPSFTTTTTTTTSTSTQNENDERGVQDGKWLRIRGEGWEADNWWVEAEVGVGDGL